MKNINFKRFFKATITFVLLTALCGILDYSMILFDHRLLLGVVIGAVGYEPIRKLLDKVQKLN